MDAINPMVVNMSQDDKRASMMDVQRKEKVKRSKKVIVEEIEDLNMAFAAEKKVCDKLAFRMEMPVELQKDEKIFDPWTAATEELTLDESLFKIGQEGDSADTVFKEIEEQLRTGQEASLAKSISGLMVDAPELQLAALDEEVMGVIVKDIMTVTMNTLTKEFKNRKVGEGKVTWELLEGSREKLLYPLHRAMAETVDLSEQNLSTQFLADRSVIQKEFRLLESVREKTKQFADENMADTANQCGKNDKLDRVRIQFLKDQNEKIETQLKFIVHQKKKRKRIEAADAQFVSSSEEEQEESTSGDDDDEGDEKETLESAQARLNQEIARERKSALKKKAAASVAGSRYAEMTEDQLEKEIQKTRKREADAQRTIRELVMECFKSEKGGVAARETTATKDDLKDLVGLKLGAKNKDNRSPSKGRMMMTTFREVILKKPDAFPAFGPMLACYAEVNVSLSKFLIGTIDRVCGWVKSEEFKNPWGLGYNQISKFAEEVKTLYDLLNAVIPASIVSSTQPDSDHDVNIRNRKIELCGVKNDAATYIEMWMTQNCYFNPRVMEQMRMHVLDIKKLFYKLPLVRACSIAMTIVRNATEQGQKISWFQTGELWVQAIKVLHSNIKVELTAKNLENCPEGCDDTDCVHVLEKVLEEISSLSTKVQGLKAGVPSKPHANSDLFLTVEDFEVAALMSTAAKLTEDLCMTVDGPSNKSGGVKPPAYARNDKNRPAAPANAIYCKAVQGKPGSTCKHYLSPAEVKYHKQRMEKIDKMTGPNKPPKSAICARHFFMIKENKADEWGMGTVLRWHGNGRAPWGKDITKSDLLIDQQHQAAVIAGQPSTAVINPTTGAAAPARVPAWGVPAATLNLVGGNISPAQKAGAPEPAPAPAPAATPAPAPAPTPAITNEDMMKILMSMQEETKNEAARSEFNRRKMQAQMDELSEKSERQVINQQREDAEQYNADRERRIEALALMDAKGITEKKKGPAFSFGKK